MLTATADGDVAGLSMCVVDVSVNRLCVTLTLAAQTASITHRLIAASDGLRVAFAGMMQPSGTSHHRMPPGSSALVVGTTAV